MPRYCLCCPEGVLDICYCSQMWHSIRVYLVFILTVTSFSVQLQRLKRSLSFKTIMRSKSVENFFQRSYSDARLPPDFITDPPPPSPPLLPGSPLVSNRSPSISPSLSPNPSISSHSPSLSLSPSLPTKPLRPQITHCFQDHVFRKPTSCQHCKHMIVGKVLNLLPRFIHSFHSFFFKAALFTGFLASLTVFVWHPIQCKSKNILWREHFPSCQRQIKSLYGDNVLSPQQVFDILGFISFLAESQQQTVSLVFPHLLAKLS